MPSQTSKTPHLKASMIIADELRRRIARGELLPGDALPSETNLTAELGYSKPTVREALRILEQEGLIAVKRGLRGGPEVRQLSIAKVAQPLGVFLQIADVPVADVWKARDRIVAGAVERLAERDDVDLGPLEEAVGELLEHVGDVESYYLDMIAVAEVAVELAGNATEHLVVVALRHIIERELRAATEAVSDVSIALWAEEEIADGWQRVVRNLRAGNRHAARAGFQAQAAILDTFLERAAANMSVGDVLRSSPEERVRAHASDMSASPPVIPPDRSPHPAG